MARIAFLGLGAMGSRMAASLIKAGHQVTIWNRTPDKTAALIAAGADAAATPRIAAKDAAFVIAMVRDDEASRAVWLDPDTGALAGMQPGAIAIDSSTLTPLHIRELAQAMRVQGVSFLDAPVAGSRPQAEAAQLIYFVGGDRVALSHAEPILKAMGAAVHHVGAVGSGAGVKLIVNALFGIQVAAIAELIGFAGKCGLDVARTIDVVASTPVCSPAVKAAAGAILGGSFVAQFPIDLVEKDFRYVSQTAEAHAGATPLCSETRAIFAEAIRRGLGDDHITGVAKLYS